MQRFTNKKCPKVVQWETAIVQKQAGSNILPKWHFAYWSNEIINQFTFTSRLLTVAASHSLKTELFYFIKKNHQQGNGGCGYSMYLIDNLFCVNMVTV